MPICNKPPPALGNIKSATEIDDHASEAAKVKRTREQAYFNSYNFDAIETLPYDNDEDEDDDAARAGSTDAKLTHHSHKPTAAALHALNNRQRLPNASLSSSKSNYSGSQRSFNALDVDVDYVRAQRGDVNYAYLQRLDALFVRTPHAARPEMTVPTANVALADEPPTHRISQVKLQHESADNGSFLLPRAMLKYQSVGSANSMPLAVLSTVHATGPTSNQLLQNASNSHSNSNSTSTSSVTKYHSGNVTVLLSNHNNTNNNNNNNNHSNITNSANAAAHASSNKTRPNYANSNDNYSSLLMVANQDTTTQAAPTAATARIKKQSTSSTATTIASSGSAEHELPPSQSVSARGRSNHLAKTLKQKASTTESERRGRTNSHQSHYSTDKSGSSGYYSSNVCSTYSLEDHIYSEPVIDVLGATNHKSKSVIGGQSQQQQQAKYSTATTASSEMERNSRMRAMNDAAQGKRYTRHSTTTGGELTHGGVDDAADDEADDDDGNRKVPATPRTTPELQITLRHKLTAATHPAAAAHFSENLRILETSIENLDRHLKNFPSLSSQEHIASFVQSHHTYLQQQPGGVDAAADKLARAQTHLPTIMEGYDAANQPRPWPEDMADDSLLDIDLDSFLLVNERQGSQRGKLSTALNTARAGDTVGGIDNPNFLTDEQEENHYKCAKYINSCPEDAYRVESDIVAGTGTGTGTCSLSEQSVTAVEHYLKRYEDQLHFQSTRELLEDVRDKIRLLSQSNNNGDLRTDNSTAQAQRQLPQELEAMIKTLKLELEIYLERMNRHSELEIRQLCSGLVKNQNIVKMKKAFERRRSTYSLGALDADYGHTGAYEAVRDGAFLSATGVPVSIREQIASIRCASDPNFKMKRKSLTEVFPRADCYAQQKSTTALATAAHQPIRSERTNANSNAVRVTVQLPVPPAHNKTQMQRNLSFQQPILNKLDAKVDSTTVTGSQVRIELSSRNACVSGSGSGNGSGAESAESGDKDSILEWHRKKPSIWEMYYGTNRMNQTLLGKRNGMVMNNSQPTMSYPSSRPESDFTLDLPRAEQLRIKMEKEKKFRQRCRYITTFLSLVFFLLTVMVVSLVLTRGKRMFGSMI